jgi:hypothetical protein
MIGLFKRKEHKTKNEKKKKGKIELIVKPRTHQEIAEKFYVHNCTVEIAESCPVLANYIVG